MPQPQPGNLDHDRSQPWISGLGDALVPMDRSALPRRGGQPGIGGNLLSVLERAEQALRPERGGRLGSNASQRQQHCRRCWYAGARLRPSEQGIALGLDSLDLFDQELEPVELPADRAPILLLWRRGLAHRTTPGLPTLVGQQRANQSLTIDLVVFRPPTP